MIPIDMLDQQDPVQQAWAQAAAGRRAGSSKGLVKDADPDSCVGAMEALLTQKRVDVRLCTHLYAVRGKANFYIITGDEDILRCPACVPEIYVQLLVRKAGHPVSRWCDCCGSWRAATGIRTVQIRTNSGFIGTALSAICADCAAEETAGLVDVDWR